MSRWFLLLLVGVLSMIIGGFAIAFPTATSLGLNYFLGISLIVLGVLSVIFGIMDLGERGAVWTIILGILMVILGVVIWQNPNIGIFSMAVIVGVLMIISGVSSIIAAFSYESGGYRWLTALSGVASLILAWFAFTSSAETLGILVGIQLIFYGFGLCGLALSARSARNLFS